MARHTTNSSAASALSRGTGSSKPAASGYRWFRNLTRKQPPLLRRGGGLPARNPRRRTSGSESRNASKSIADINRQHSPVYKRRRGFAENHTCYLAISLIERLFSSSHSIAAATNPNRQQPNPKAPRSTPPERRPSLPRYRAPNANRHQPRSRRFRSCTSRCPRQSR